MKKFYLTPDVYVHKLVGDVCVINNSQSLQPEEVMEPIDSDDLILD
ncbi:MAG: hypothetical protein MJZ29_09945 [Bacteroidaceae bacterium]|nr:hypothetical protein [Bacteroidaceae bacterium]